VSEIAEAIAEHIGGQVCFVEWPAHREAIEIGDAVISNAKIKALLGWAPQFDLAAGLARTAAYFRPRLDAYL
jgi:UDP-glucose 4-epimerase